MFCSNLPSVYDGVLTYLRQSTFDDLFLLEEFSANETDIHQDYSSIQHKDTELVHINKQAVTLPEPETRRRASATEFCSHMSSEVILQIVANANSALIQLQPRRPYPSAGAIYPIELLIGISSGHNFDNLPSGIYHHLPYSNQLELVSKFKGEELIPAMNFGEARRLFERSTVIFYALNVEKCIKKYGYRGLIFGAIDVGAICRNVELEVEKKGGVSRVWGGYRAAQLCTAIGLDPSQLPIIATQLIGMER